MKLLGNIIWILFGGLAVSLEYFAGGLLYCVTIIGIPFGLQLLKLGLLALVPFGQEPEYKPQEPGCLSTLFNIIWIITGGLIICLTHFLFGILFTITIIGIPFGKQHFKLMRLSFSPFGQTLK